MGDHPNDKEKPEAAGGNRQDSEEFALLEAIFASAPVGLAFLDRDLRYVRLNQALAQLNGLPVEAHLGRTPADILPEATGELMEALKQVLLTGKPQYNRVLRANSLAAPEERRAFMGSLYPVPLNGETAGVGVVVTDITELRRSLLYEAANQATGRLERLQAVTAAFSEALTPQQVAAVVVEQGVAALGADAGSVALLNQEEMKLEVLASVGYSTELIERWRRFPVSSPAPLAEAVRSSQANFVGSTAEKRRRFPELAAEDSSSYQAFASIPLLVEGRMLGAMGLSFNDPQAFSEEDRTFILALARQCAQALERARLYEAERRARQLAEARTSRIIRLQKVTAALSRALTPAEIAGVIVEQGLTMLEPAAGVVVAMNKSWSAFEVLGSVGRVVERIEPIYRYQTILNTPSRDAMWQGRPVLLSSRRAAAQQYPHLTGQFLPDHQSWAAVPLMLDNRAMGAMVLAFDQEQAFSTEEVEFMMALASQCAQALERARLYQVEAETLAEAEAEIETRKQTEQRLETALQEKEVLLREVNHRVKNNLQGVSNLLYLQAHYIKDPEVRRKLEETQNRVKSIALIHQKLYENEEFTRINFAEYVESLARSLIQSYRVNPKLIKLEVEDGSAGVDVDTAVTLGIIVNELVSNALKHAFPAEQAGVIRIELKPETDGRLTLTTSDDGQGLPMDEDVLNGGSLGLQLVQMLAGHMRGRLDLERLEKGARFVVSVDPSRETV